MQTRQNSLNIEWAEYTGDGMCPDCDFCRACGCAHEVGSHHRCEKSPSLPKRKLVIGMNGMTRTVYACLHPEVIEKKPYATPKFTDYYVGVDCADPIGSKDAGCIMRRARDGTMVVEEMMEIPRASWSEDYTKKIKSIEERVMESMRLPDWMLFGMRHGRAVTKTQLMGEFPEESWWDRVAIHLACRFEVECERYDDRVLTGARGPDGGKMPRDPDEQRLMLHYARDLHEQMHADGHRLGIPVECMTRGRKIVNSWTLERRERYYEFHQLGLPNLIEKLLVWGLDAK